eukprot:6196047-Pleurochrysis_carterae.AAC.9
MEDLGPKTNADALHKSSQSTTKSHITGANNCALTLHFLRRFCFDDFARSQAIQRLCYYSTSWKEEGQPPPLKVDEPNAVCRVLERSPSQRCRNPASTLYGFVRGCNNCSIKLIDVERQGPIACAASSICRPDCRIYR